MEEKAEYNVSPEESKEAIDMLGKGYDEITTAKDESNDRRYFTITPRIVKALSRNAFDFSLWDTIKDVAGENGECFLNTDQLAILSGMSTGQVSKSRKYWLKIGFLKGEIKKDPGFSQAVWHLTVPDLWQKNIEWCEKYPKIKSRLEFRKAHRSLHTVKPSHSEGKPSHSEAKKNNKEDLIKRDSEIFTKLSELTGGGLNSNTPKFVDAWLERHTPVRILEAIQIARDNKARSTNYVDKILLSWEANGYPKTREERVAERKAKHPISAYQQIQKILAEQRSKQDVNV